MGLRGGVGGVITQLEGWGERSEAWEKWLAPNRGSERVESRRVGEERGCLEERGRLHQTT